MKIKDLTTAQLEFVVGSCLGYILSFSDTYGLEILHRTTRHQITNTDYATSWDDASGAIERMRKTGIILIGPAVSFAPSNCGEPKLFSHAGPTLEALMRCYAESVMGENVSPDIASLLEKYETHGDNIRQKT